MAIAFPNASRSYDANRGVIRFWGHDSAMEAAFFITNQALQHLQPDATGDEDSMLAVFDRPATVVLKWRGNGEPTAWNPVFQDVMLQLGVGVELCWPASGNQKGAVENLVGFVKGSFFKQRRFVDKEDMLTQLQQWQVEVNNVRPSRATGVPPAERMAAERERLRPLRVTPSELVLKYPVVVGPTAYVLFNTNAYSMPPQTVGLPATLYLQRESLTIVVGNHNVTHPRLTGKQQKSTLPSHRGQLVAAVHGKRAHNYAKRQQLLDLGQSVFDWLTELIHRREKTWHSDVNRLFELLLEHGDQRLLAAIEHANHQRVFGAEYVAHSLRTLEVPQ